MFGVGFRRSRRPSALRDEKILCRINSYPVQPGIKRGIAAKMAQRTKGLDKGFLHHVFRFGRIVHEARHQAHQPALIFGHQQVERPAIASLDALYQQLITLAFGCH